MPRATRSTTRSARSSSRSSRRRSPTSTSSCPPGVAVRTTWNSCARSGVSSIRSRAAAAWSARRPSASSAGTSKTCSTACSTARVPPAPPSSHSCRRCGTCCRNCMRPCAGRRACRWTLPRWRAWQTASALARKSCWMSRPPANRRCHRPSSKQRCRAMQPAIPPRFGWIRSCWRSSVPRSAVTWKPSMRGSPLRAMATRRSTMACCARSIRCTARSR